MIVVVGELVFMLHGIGSSRTISRSNKINKIATRKNWIEIGDRASPIGSKPHSYGESLLMSGLDIMYKLMMYRAVTIVNDIIDNDVRSIISSLVGLSAWKALVLLVY